MTETAKPLNKKEPQIIDLVFKRRLTKCDKYEKIPKEKLKTLRKQFQQNPYPEKQIYENLAQELSLSFVKIVNWFKFERKKIQKSAALNKTYKKRKILKIEECKYLEEQFRTNLTPSSEDFSEMAKTLNCKKKLVRNWFAYRRKKLNKLKTDSKVEDNFRNNICESPNDNSGPSNSNPDTDKNSTESTSNQKHSNNSHQNIPTSNQVASELFQNYVPNIQYMQNIQNIQNNSSNPSPIPISSPQPQFIPYYNRVQPQANAFSNIGLFAYNIGNNIHSTNNGMYGFPQFAYIQVGQPMIQPTMYYLIRPSGGLTDGQIRKEESR